MVVCDLNHHQNESEKDDEGVDLNKDICFTSLPTCALFHAITGSEPPGLPIAFHFVCAKLIQGGKGQKEVSLIDLSTMELCFISLSLLLGAGHGFHVPVFHQARTSPTTHGRRRVTPLTPSLGRPDTTLFFHLGSSQEEALASSSSLPKTTLVLKHRETRSSVYIIGCVHGSEASEEDVKQVIKGEDVSVVVLELCQSRYQSMALDSAGEEEEYEEERSQNAEEAEARNKLLDMSYSVSQFTKNYGLLQTMLVGLLSISAEVQRFFARKRSCEFRTSVALAKAKNAEIVLGDQDLRVTLTRFRKGWKPREIKQMAFELSSIRDALLGPGKLSADKKVNVLTLLFTQERYIREVLKIILPISAVVLLGMEVVESIGSATMASINDVSTGWIDGGPTASSSSTLTEFAENVGWSAMHAFTLLYALSINRYILVERDQFLAQSIARAAQDHPGEKIAAVVGLLHGNGVSRHLTKMGFELVSRNTVA